MDPCNPHKHALNDFKLSSWSVHGNYAMSRACIYSPSVHALTSQVQPYMKDVGETSRGTQMT